MKLGLRAHDLVKGVSAETLAKRVNDYAGPLGRPLCLHFAPYKALSDVPKPLSEEWARATHKTLTDAGVQIAILGCYINPAHPDPEKMDSELRVFENGIDMAPLLGGPIVATETGSRDERNVRCEETWTEKNFSVFLKNVERLLKKAEKTGVRMALEAVADKNTIDNAQRMLRVMETFKHPNLGVLFDAVNIMPIHTLGDAASYRMFYDEAVSMLRDYICAMHIKDYDWVPTSKEYPSADPLLGKVKNGNLPVGFGLMDWKMLFSIYKKYGVTGVPMTLENYKPETLLQSLEYVDKCFMEA